MERQGCQEPGCESLETMHCWKCRRWICWRHGEMDTLQTATMALALLPEEIAGTTSCPRQYAVYALCTSCQEQRATEMMKQMLPDLIPPGTPPEVARILEGLFDPGDPMKQARVRRILEEFED